MGSRPTRDDDIRIDKVFIARAPIRALKTCGAAAAIVRGRRVASASGSRWLSPDQGWSRAGRGGALPGSSRSAFMARHIEHPGCAPLEPGVTGTPRSRPSFSACALTALIRGQPSRA